MKRMMVRQVYKPNVIEEGNSEEGHQTDAAKEDRESYSV